MKITGLISALLTIAVLASCNGRGASGHDISSGDTLTSKSELLTIVDCGDYTAVMINDPWNEGRLLASYALVDRNTTAKATVPEGFQTIKIPLERSIVYSSTNMSAIGELGRLDEVCAVADGNYYNSSDTVAKLIAAGRLTDIGNSMSPKLETLVELSPDAILTSPYENAGHGVLDALKVPIIECADYMEKTPIGRAEWLLLLGELYGERDKARKLYSQVAERYESLRDSIAATVTERPRVLTELLTSGVWYVPGGQSYMANMLRDAGADYPWSDNASAGSLQLDAAAVIDKASNADIWIMRNFGDVTLGSLAEMSPLYTNIKAYQNGNIYNCDLSESVIFNDIAFHPERILADMAAMFHPELFSDYKTRYYSKIKEK